MSLAAPRSQTIDRFGSSIASLGDLDGDGVADLAVGAAGDDTGGNYRGAVHVLFMNANGTVKSSQKIASGMGGGPALANGDVFGIGVASLGDLDGDGVTDLAVGAFRDDTGGLGRGAVHVLFMNANGTVKRARRSPAAPVAARSRRRRLLRPLGRRARRSRRRRRHRPGRRRLSRRTGGASRGALHVLFLTANGTVKRAEKIAQRTGGGPTLANDSRFGSGVAALGDLDGDGVIDLAVGAETDDTGGSSRGAVYVLFLKPGNTQPGIHVADHGERAREHDDA